MLWSRCTLMAVSSVCASTVAVLALSVRPDLPCIPPCCGRARRHPRPAPFSHFGSLCSCKCRHFSRSYLLHSTTCTCSTTTGILVHGRFLGATPLTTEGFKSYGGVIDGPSSNNPDKWKEFKIVNQGTAKKYLNLAQILNNYPSEAGAKTNIHVYRCDPAKQLPFEVKLLERHRFTTQAFIPMVPIGGKQQGYLVVVAQNGQGRLPFHISTLIFSRYRNKHTDPFFTSSL